MLDNVGHSLDIGLDDFDRLLGKEVGTGIAGGENDKVEMEWASELMCDIVSEKMVMGIAFVF